MTAVVGGLGAALLEREELIAQIDKGRGFAPAAKLEIEQATVKRQRLIDITDLKSDMVETDGARFLGLGHRSLRLRPQPSYGDVTGTDQYALEPRSAGRAG